MMIRLFASALLVAGLSQAALAQTGTRQNQPSTSTENTQASQNLPQSIQQRLSSAGFSDVNVMPGSFVITAKDRNGRPVMMRITPTSMAFLTEVPDVNSSTTGTGTGSSNETTQQNRPSASAENMQTPQDLPQALRQRLTSAGFNDVNVVPSSLLITGRDRSGSPVMMRITPNSMFFLTEIPAASSSTTGRGNSNESGQSR